MKIVLIGQWAYPEQNPRAQRAWQLGLQLAKVGHDVTLYALLGKDYDYSFIEERYGLKVRNLGFSRRGLTDSEGRRRKGLVPGIIKNLVNEYDYYPGCDFRPMVRRALECEGKIDLLISIASPHSIHWSVAKCIDRNEVMTWIADSGDPFMLNPFFKHHSWMERRERLWCGMCDFITVPLEEARKSYYPEYSDKIRVIPQGFDFKEVDLPRYEKNTVPTFVFSGRAYSKLRDPERFLEYLSSVDREFEFKVYTNSPKFFQNESLADKMTVKGFILRTKLLVELAKADFLVNLTNRSSVQSPSKLIDYGLSGRPVLDISSEFTEEERKHFEEFFEGNYSSAHKIVGLEQYDIVNVAKAFISLAI